jgi:hypothetical protein
MKNICTAFILCLFTFSLRASDTITLRQAYNLHIGDTFDYKISNSNPDWGLNEQYYERRVLMQKSYSANQDTVFLAFGPPGGSPYYFITQSSLDSQAIYYLYGQDYSGCDTSYSFDTTTYPGIISNTTAINCFESFANIRHSAGLGRTLYSVGGIANNSNGCVCSSEELVYYSNGTKSCGTPYDLLDGSKLIRFTPLPEECAIWTEQVWAGSPYPPSSLKSITKQFRTGNKTYKNGHTYVAIICRIQDNLSGHYTPDSLVGYFYNDTLAGTSYYAPDTTVNGTTVMYHTGYLNGDGCGGMGMIVIDTVLIGGQWRTRWNCEFPSPYYPSENNCVTSIIGGIGYLSGLFPITVLNTYSTCSSLICFSVCGKNLYGSDTSTTCPLLSDINTDAGAATYDFNVWPNPANQSVHLHSSAEFTGSTITVTDVTGRIITTFAWQKSDAELDAGTWANGIYFIRLNYGSAVTTRKLVIQK